MGENEAPQEPGGCGHVLDSSPAVTSTSCQAGLGPEQLPPLLAALAATVLPEIVCKTSQPQMKVSATRLPWQTMKEGPRVGEVPSLCSDAGHGWTHCPLFPLLLATLGQMASIVEYSRAGGMGLSPLVALDRALPMGILGAPVCVLRV